MVYMIVVLFTILCKKRPRLALNLSEQKKTPHSHWKLIATTSIHKNNQYFLGWYFEKKGAPADDGFFQVLHPHWLPRLMI